MLPVVTESTQTTRCVTAFPEELLCNSTKGSLERYFRGAWFGCFVSWRDWWFGMKLVVVKNTT
ncbi:MAG TPA: hypothetical protein DCE11_01120 [Ruminiclostridium sp.]|jgi:hypothetical protein|nr:hypothetical protein [Ruminiclostridium sp.]